MDRAASDTGLVRSGPVFGKTRITIRVAIGRMKIGEFSARGAKRWPVHIALFGTDCRSLARILARYGMPTDRDLPQYDCDDSREQQPDNAQFYRSLCAPRSEPFLSR